jgi:hypothetical protein
MQLIELPRALQSKQRRAAQRRFEEARDGDISSQRVGDDLREER